MKNRFLKFSLVYLIAYVLLLIMPGVIVYPVDWLSGLITGVKYVDGGTHGFMAYTALAVLLPFLYVILLVVYWFNKRIKSKNEVQS